MMHNQDRCVLEALTNIRCYENDHGYSILGAHQAEAVLSAIETGKIPGVYAESPGIDYMKVRQALSALSGKPAMCVVTMDHIKEIGEQISHLRAQLAEAEKERDNLRRDLCEIAKGCGVGVADEAEAKRRIIAIRAERDALMETLGRDGEYLKREPTDDDKRIENADYRGKSVWAWWAKAHAYGHMVHGVNPILGAKDGEHTNDAAKRVVAERDAALVTSPHRLAGRGE